MFNIITNSDASCTPVNSVRSHTITLATKTSWAKASTTSPDYRPAYTKQKSDKSRYGLKPYRLFHGFVVSRRRFQ
ncbi:hypothetical protein AB0758_48935 [Tolypothrix bouteillei VB521301_2]|uniref:hypothetical protein n=1 Tax=Tolypothrix bouteillei TaxID=1246981 RepID=UPI0010FA7F4E